LSSRVTHPVRRRTGRSRPRFAAGLLALAALIAIIALPALGARGPAITIDYPEPRPAERILPTIIGGASYVSTNDLARVFSATKYWRPEIQKLSLRIGDHTLRFTVGAPLVLLDETEWTCRHAKRTRWSTDYPSDLGSGASRETHGNLAAQRPDRSTQCSPKRGQKSTVFFPRTSWASEKAPFLAALLSP
jgi:hypothetical protein